MNAYDHKTTIAMSGYQPLPKLPSDFDRRMIPHGFHNVRVLDKGTQLDVLIVRLPNRSIVFAIGWEPFMTSTNPGQRITRFSDMPQRQADGTQTALEWLLMHENQKVLLERVVDVRETREMLIRGDQEEEQE